MQALTARWRWPAGVALVALAAGMMFGDRALGASDSLSRSEEDFTVQVTRIDNPESRFLRTNISSTSPGETQQDLYFYKVRDNKNSRILYFVYYQGSMLAPLYTTGD